MLAGTQGFEPRFHGPVPCVLPLNDVPTAADANKKAGCASINRTQLTRLP